jgi:hypothetical protein
MPAEEMARQKVEQAATERRGKAMSETLQNRVLKELGYGMGCDHERDVAFVALWVSRRSSDGALVATTCNMADEPLEGELRAKVVEVLRRLADGIEAGPDPNTVYYQGKEGEG